MPDSKNMPRRPRFVVAIVVAALVVVAYECFSLFTRPAEIYEQVWFGMKFRGEAARVAAVPHVVIYLVGSWGLWRQKSWARIAAMGYFGYLLLSFVLWGLRNEDHTPVFQIMAWQMVCLPFNTFCFMFLYNGSRYFR